MWYEQARANSELPTTEEFLSARIVKVVLGSTTIFNENSSYGNHPVRGRSTAISRIH